ncbi:ABC transporter ATP-binding protein [Halolactibacillus miurensis]|uniref:ABC transporter ATP-binding protein n=1 Tax=Halolactibacillus miurensis TaxID=306541 RepID=A0A1I6SKR6_9BACI|nr:ABC transporter ATP-binding protein [Halolactibacillus miurensis]GEM04038.1 ABC transporter ATP-binding protein [Halolactibacillus miurensis]SFS77358.1 ABC-2 type transport system ATP-binding protein [Halolactibacillus miurensis]
MAILTVEDLTVKQGETLALNGMNLSVETGEVVALIGHNGAGKSTFFKTVMGMIDLRDGSIEIDGFTKDSLAYKQRVVYIPEQPFLLPELTVFQHFQLYLESYQQHSDEKVNKIHELTRRFEIADQLDQFPLQLSKGMKQKVQLIAGLIIDAPVLLIDEPFVGLDIYAQQELTSILIEKKQKDQAVILTTHQFDQLEGVMDRYVMLHQGKVIKEGDRTDLGELKRRFD